MRAVPWTEESWRNHPSCATITIPATMHAMLAATTMRCARGLPLIFSRTPQWPGSAHAACEPLSIQFPAPPDHFHYTFSQTVIGDASSDGVPDPKGNYRTSFDLLP
jgi:hypothetical protein